MPPTILKVVRILPAVLSLVILFQTFPTESAIAALFAVTIHECGHIAAAFLAVRRLPRLTGQAGGLCLSSPVMTTGESLFYAAGGCLMNLLTVLVALPFAENPAGNALIGAGLGACLFNLLPAPPLDGAKILSLLLSFVLPPSARKEVCRVISALTVFLFFFLSLGVGLGETSFFYGVYLALCLLVAHLDTF